IYMAFGCFVETLNDNKLILLNNTNG
ncbi:MAG: hypothetical protein RL528_51, partial [Bacteroidota bacterium]